jgi:hypothetical protein
MLDYMLEPFENTSDDALDREYAEYLEENGEDALSFDKWLNKVMSDMADLMDPDDYSYDEAYA